MCPSHHHKGEDDKGGHQAGQASHDLCSKKTSETTKLHDLEWEAKQEACVGSMPGDLMLVKYSDGEWENENMIQEEIFDREITS